MKNITTPRTLADCQWVTGYSSASYSRDANAVERWAHRVMYAVAIAFLAGLAAGYFGA